MNDQLSDADQRKRTEYLRKASQADAMASRATDAMARTSWELIAISFRELAEGLKRKS